MNGDLTPKALVADDNFYNRDLCKLALEHVGYDVTEAETGLEAVNILENQSFDLLILDLAMPGLSGLGVLREISRDQGMSIIVMTANPHMATEEVEKSIDFLMCKPIDINEFTSLLRRLSQSRSKIKNQSAYT
jgi:CheY-like chemotaxis protein